MSDQLIAGVVTVLTAIVGVAVLAVLFSRNSNTAGVVTAGGNAFASSLLAAEAPITGVAGQNSFGGMNYGGMYQGF